MWQFERKKNRNIVTSAIYRIGNLLPISDRVKFKIFSDISWITNRISLELANKMISRDVMPQTSSSDAFIIDHINGNDAVLDLGCAYGNITKIVSVKCRKILGVDHDPNLIKYAKQYNSGINIDYKCGDALDILNAEGSSYDAMICSHILEHIDKPVELLNKFKVFFNKIYVEVPDNDSNSINYIREIVSYEPLYSDADHIWEFTRKDMKSIFDNVGLVVTSENHSFGVMRFWVGNRVS